MIKVELNGQLREEDFGAFTSIPDLLEYIKSQVDPDTMIVDMAFNGQQLTDEEWNSPLSLLKDKVLQIATGTRRQYIKDRLVTAPTLVEQIAVEFDNVGKAYHSGANVEANNKLSLAVKDLGAFVRWYNSLLTMDNGLESQLREFLDKISSLQAICEQLHKQQMFQSWWSAGDTINQKLKPKLDEIKNYCENTAAI